MEILGKILGSPARVKIMRLFLLNPTKSFSNKEVAKRSRVDIAAARREIRLLLSIKFIKHRGKEWSFNPLFKYAGELEDLLVGSETLDKDAIADSFKKVGRVKLLLVSGVFIKNKDSRVDLLIVGDRMKRGKIDEEIRKLEAEIGMELVYAVFDTKDFLYRLNMFDKLIRDILDFPHEILLQGKELSTQSLKKA
ncbi:MAG: hypothetical protein WDN09_00015 [bacterium]